MEIIKKIKFSCTTLINVLTTLILCINSTSCSSEIDENMMGSKFDERAKYNEKNYSFKTIDLWGSEAAVVDAGEYYIFQGDIYLDKKDLCKTRGSGVLNRRWPNNKVYYTMSDVPNDKSKILFDALNYIEMHTYLTFIPRLENETNYINIT